MALHLPRRDGNVGMPAQIGQGASIVLVQRLLEPGQVAILDRPTDREVFAGVFFPYAMKTLLNSL